MWFEKGLLLWCGSQFNVTKLLKTVPAQIFCSSLEHTQVVDCLQSFVYVNKISVLHCYIFIVIVQLYSVDIVVIWLLQTFPKVFNNWTFITRNNLLWFILLFRESQRVSRWAAGTAEDVSAEWCERAESVQQLQPGCSLRDTGPR